MERVPSRDVQLCAACSCGVCGRCGVRLRGLSMLSAQLQRIGLCEMKLLRCHCELARLWGGFLCEGVAEMGASA